MGVAKVPHGFKLVKDIQKLNDGNVRIIGNSRLRVDIPLQLGFLETSTLAGLIE